MTLKTQRLQYMFLTLQIRPSIWWGGKGHFWQQKGNYISCVVFQVQLTLLRHLVYSPVLNTYGHTATSEGKPKDKPCSPIQEVNWFFFVQKCSPELPQMLCRSTHTYCTNWPSISPVQEKTIKIWSGQLLCPHDFLTGVNQASKQ